MPFGARAELEGEREDLVYGPPRTEQELIDRVIAALAEQAAATAATANDRPVLVDLGRAHPTPPAPAAVPVPPAMPRHRHQYRHHYRSQHPSGAGLGDGHR